VQQSERLDREARCAGYTVFIAMNRFRVAKGSEEASEERSMKKDTLQSMSIDALWKLHEEIDHLLNVRLEAKRRQLNQRLVSLGQKVPSKTENHRRRYPKVLPKFQNPAEPAQTWAGRGRQPRWVSAMLETGKSIDDLRILKTA
jgi:DNA-binding protein H-NS